MAWKIEFRPGALKDLKKLDKSIQKKILKFLNEKILKLENPRSAGKSLSYNLHGLWRYRLQDFRIICQIKDKELIILVIQLGHRKDIYNY